MSVLRSMRPAVSALRAALRTPTVPRAAVRVAPAAVLSTVRQPSARGFVSTRLARGEGETDVALSSRLIEEIKYETENAAESATAEEPAFLTEFKKEAVWEITDQDGHDEVTLKRTFGNETIRVLFSIADIDTDTTGFEEEPEEGEEATPNYPIRISVTITKPDQGALTIDALAEEGAFVIDNISFYQDQKLATELTAEADWDRRGVYIGPHFDHLDVNVQEEFEKYLVERGISDDLAMFIPDYAEWKEQREYVKWLKNVKAFVDA